MVKKLGKMPVIMFDVKARMALKIDMSIALIRTKDLMRLFSGTMVRTATRLLPINLHLLELVRHVR